ncbi:MOSC domain-containing protein YiiM [Catalinimonas alkaloidigena]|uniref:MOSC domain-containing protein YiiM n=2 Tax=Catalinimonas alkaloidigena TaxID=1075417 RepID=A0A1G9BC53_9BACT|nr:MOSC domain-containing protein YiiM [Catalinimonas alkaloidigena]
MQIHPHAGALEWIGLRPGRDAPMQVVDEVEVQPGQGLKGDRFSGKNSDKRAVTLIHAEHLTAVASYLHREDVDPGLVRRNLVVRGLNLLALKERQFRIGEEVILEWTGECHPCSKMEKNLGPGGYNAMRQHGGITARVIQGGTIRRGDAIVPL